MNTIFALSTPPGRGGVAVVRISGPDIPLVCEHLGIGDLPERQAVLQHLSDASGEMLDQAIVIRFGHGRSFTGEEVLELHLHGSLAVRDAVLNELGTIQGCRPALPGEFTRRALENGRMDLTEVEGLAALIDAETEAQRKQAQIVLSGALRELAEGWREGLTGALALLTVTIDFSDEDVPEDVFAEVREMVNEVIAELKAEIEGSRVAERVREGFVVAIVGAPNAGKSTLLNALAGREAALTSEVAGTTRDVIEVRMDLDGQAVTLLDTAGLRETSDEIEGLGIERAAERAADADIRVFLRSNDGSIPDIVVSYPDDIHIWGKGDLYSDGRESVSGLTGAGLDGLVQRLSKTLHMRASSAGVATHIRHRQLMKAAVLNLERAVIGLAQSNPETELIAEEVRLAGDVLSEMVGRIGVESILDEIFSRFCLGK